ncbi:antibiotic biosynthesis monooxygenase [Deinococcus sonorensis]|uniref:Antibiotic biosynthesis monooxygenase n=2 Tax=Deinococcus sonorensis TaxID=309891 RepID=A0AAU7UDB5_9DEIO
MTRPAELQDPVTIVVRRRVRAGQEAAYETWLGALSSELAHFSGHLGLGVIRPAPGERNYTMVVRFTDFDSAEAWEHSAERARCLAEVEPLLDGETTIDKQPGLEFWFTPPGSPTLRQPPRWKMVLLTVLALYPTSLLVNLTLGPLLGHLPLVVRVLFQSLLIVPTMTYLVMPLITRGFAAWLSPPAPTQA